MAIEQIINQVFGDADTAHKNHLLTQSFSEHEALGEFYVDARKEMDALVEAMLGLEIQAPDGEATTPLDAIEEGYVALVNMRESACQGDTTLLTLFDNLTAVYTRALFKLRRLS